MVGTSSVVSIASVCSLSFIPITGTFIMEVYFASTHICTTVFHNKYKVRYGYKVYLTKLTLDDFWSTLCTYVHYACIVFTEGKYFCMTYSNVLMHINNKIPVFTVSV